MHIYDQCRYVKKPDLMWNTSKYILFEEAWNMSLEVKLKTNIVRWT